jgi:hypothetical protein
MGLPSASCGPACNAQTTAQLSDSEMPGRSLFVGSASGQALDVDGGAFASVKRLPRRHSFSVLPGLTRAMPIRLNCVEEMGHARSGGWTFNL